MKQRLTQTTEEQPELQVQSVQHDAIREPNAHAPILKEIITLATQLIEIPSVTNNPEKLSEVLATAGNQLKSFTIEPFLSNGYHSLLVHNAKPETKQFKIILNAHLDVVAAKPSQFKPTFKDGRLYGRGSYDMKSAAAVMILLFKEIAQKIPYPLALQLITEEEIFEENGTAYQLDQGVRGDFAIIGECGSNLNIVHEAKGILRGKLVAEGFTAHGAYLWQGKNAIIKMFEALAVLNTHFPVPTDETYETTINISHISTHNEAWNKVPDNCTAFIDVRVKGADSKTILARILDLLPEGVKLEVETERSHHYTAPDHTYIKQLTAIAEDVTGKKAEIKKTHGGSDTIYFTAIGSDAIEFGPIGGGQHHDEEWVDINSLNDYYQILKKFLLSIK